MLMLKHKDSFPIHVCYIHLDNVDHVNLFVSNRIQTLGLYLLKCKFRNGSTMVMANMGRLFRLEANKTDHKNVT